MRVAQTLKNGTFATSGPGVVMQRPHMAALLGNVVAEWSHLEQWLQSFYGYLMGFYLPRFPGAEPPFHPVARQIFDTLETSRLRMELFRNLYKWMFTEADLLKQSDECFRLWTTASKARNKIVHGNWCISDAHLDALILSPNFGNKLVYTEADFADASKKITAALNALSKLWNDSRAARATKSPP